MVSPGATRRPTHWRWPGQALAVLTAYVAVAAAPAEAQIPGFIHYTALEGLPQTQVLALYQDRRSFLWIGTYGGLTRFDGREFRTLTRRDGLTANTVRALAEDDSGRLLVGTIGGGVCIREGAGFRCLGTEAGLPNPDVLALLPDPGGGFWAGTEGGLVHIAGDVVTTYTDQDGLPGTIVTHLARDASGRLWVGTTRGLVSREQTGAFIPHPSPALRGEAITFLRTGGDELLIGTAAAAYIQRGDQLNRVPHLPEGDWLLADAVRDSSGELWLATRSGAVIVGDGHVEQLTRADGLLDDIVNTVYADREGNVWLGTESGLSKSTPGPFVQFTTAEGLPNPFVRALAEDFHGQLWVGTRDGVGIHGQGGIRTLPLPGVPDTRVYALAELSPTGGMLVGTRDGLVHYRHGVVGRYTTDDGLPHDSVTSLLSDGPDRVWVGTADGLARFVNGRIEPVTHPSIGSPYVVSLAQDRRGRLWIGRRTGGVTIVDGNTSSTLGPENGLSGETIWAIAEDPSGTMWVATNGDGAFCIRPDGTIDQFTTETGLVNDFVWQAQPDRRGGVWLFTNLGLDFYAEGRFHHYGRDDGLTILEGSASASWQDRRGDLWFGTGRGLVRYRAALDVPHDAAPVVYIEALTAAGEVLPLADPEVPSGSGGIRIRYTSPTFRDTEGLRFRYRLDADQEWSPPTTDRAVAFGRLEPGHHVFEVQAISGDFVASATPARLTFTVLPAFWQTWWFRVLASVAVMLALGMALWLHGRHLRRDHQRLERVVAEHTSELAAKNAQLEREVHERREVDTALRQNEQRLRDIVEHSTNLFYSLTTDLTFTYLSPQSAYFFGHAPDAAPRCIHDVLTDDPVNQEGLACTLRAIATSAQQPPHTLEIRGPDGAHRWVEVNETPVLRDGRTVAVVGSLTDVTESKLARASEERLEEQLRQAQKMEAVGQLAGGIAHDFNNQLTAIIGYTEFAIEAVPAGSEMLGDLEVVRRTAAQASTLVSQLLTFSRQQMVKRVTLDLNVVAAEATRMLRRVLSSNIELNLDLAPAAAWVLADQGQLDQVLLNLAVNSRDAMPMGGRLSIRISHATTDGLEPAEVPAGEYIVLDVEDTGHGIDPEIQHRLFDPFFTTKEVGKGTGLGLATVYGIVKQNGGHIMVASTVGRGTRFRTYFPASEEPRPASDANRSSPATRTAAQRSILVVEDQPNVRDMVCQTLERRGYSVLQAEDGQAALELSRRFDGRIHLLLTDMIMPGLNGRQVADVITAERRDIRVLFMSGHADGVLGRNGLIEDEATQLIRKPFTPAELSQRIAEVLQTAAAG